MNYDFKTLSPADFEDLARDLVGADEGVRFEGFGAGPDGGIDGRHATSSGSIIMQAKHRVGSSFPSLLTTLKKERTAIQRLNPKRYILVTSQILTPPRKDKIQLLLLPFVNKTKDIIGATELNDLLRRHPNIEKGNIKLWLSSAAVLDRLLKSASVAYTAITKEEILAKVAVYAQNPSFDEALRVLEHRHVVIVSGAPGVGKTTLAQMLAYAFIGESWEFVAIKSLDDGFSAIDDSKRQVFFFDDFLGKIALDKKALASKDADLTRFIQRVQRSKNARFILTTRAYIYEEARNISENIGDKRLEISKYVLNVGIYTRRVRARILYNHLLASGLGVEFIAALVESGLLAKIVDHKNYNPRIIEWMTDSALVTVSAKEYAAAFVEALDKPFAIWDRAFREHIPEKAQHLLISLFFSPQFGTPINDLQEAFDGVHSRLCATHRLSSSPTDFEDSLRLLEGSFISISDGSVSFVNPSVRDYLATYLSNESLLIDLAPASRTASWASSLWEYSSKIVPAGGSGHMRLAKALADIGSRFDKLPVAVSEGGKVRRKDLALSDRVELLADWAALTDMKVLSDSLLRLVERPPGLYSPWYDGDELPGLISTFRAGRWRNLPHADVVADRLEEALISVIEEADPDDLKRIMRALEVEDSVPESVRAVFEAAVKQEISSVKEAVEVLESEPDIEDHVETLSALAEWLGLNISMAKEVADARIEELRSTDFDYPDPSFPEIETKKTDFDDNDLRNLFESLIQS